MNKLFDDLQDYEVSRARSSRPFVTLSYAQTLDGSISGRRGERLTISGDESMHLTHRLRTHHDGILVGIGTLLADDPQLTARHVPGEQPQPVLLDSLLRIPEDAKLFAHPKKPWIFTSDQADLQRQEELRGKGVNVIQVCRDEEDHLYLEEILAHLHQSGIQRLMVEGGGTVIANFLASGWVDAVVLTIAPTFVGGLKGVDRLLGNGNSLAQFPRLLKMQYSQIGEDLIVWGQYQERKQ